MGSRSISLVFVLLAACGASSPSGSDAGGAVDAFAAADTNVAAPDTNAPAFTALAPCAATSDYVDDPTGANVVTFGPAFAYSPQCIHIPTGDQVTFRGDFATHPLHPSTRGTSGNPIPLTGPTPAPAEQLVVFPHAGFYPYYCAVHGADDGTSMAGVVWVD